MLVLKRSCPNQSGCFQWLIANGSNMGRWTYAFGANCLADMQDNKIYLRLTAEDNPGSKIERYEIKRIT